MPQIEKEIKRELRDAEIPLKDVAETIGKSYSTLVQYLNGFTPLPGEIRLKIRRMIDEQRKSGGISE